MESKKHFLLGLVVGMLFVFMAGCGNEKITPTIVESGTMNEDYKGNPNPVAPKEMFLSDEEKANGIQKIKIKSGIQMDAPVQPQQPTNEDQQQSGGESNAKPHI